MEYVVRRILWIVIFMLAGVALYAYLFRLDDIVGGWRTVAYTGKCYSSCTDPDRPSYDSWGNEYDAAGRLIKSAPCSVDPITGQPNPVTCAVNTDGTIVPLPPNFGGK